MRTTHKRLTVWCGLVPIVLLLAGQPEAYAQNAATPAAQTQTKTSVAVQSQPPSFEVYGFAMLDIGHDFKTINPNWFDTMRVTRLPSFEGEFGENHNTFAGVRQSRLGVRSSTPTDLGDLKTTFEFELFGTGVDEGQTTFRLRHAYGELGRFGAGQWWSPFMDPDVFPNTIEYRGPTGMVFFRNVQVRWYAWSDDKSSLVLALERPGASGDQGVYADRVELDGIRARFPAPDFSGAWKFNGDWGYGRVAGIVRSIKWDDTLDDGLELGGSATGWGLNFSSNLKFGTSVVRLQYVVGEGIQNYMNDSPVDIGVQTNFGDPVTPLLGKALPMTGLVAFIDLNWNAKYTSSFGYSRQDIDNSDGQAPNAFKNGQYFVGNLLYLPAPNVMVGGELQWGRRENFSDGFSSDGVKLQFSFKYNFSHKWGG